MADEVIEYIKKQKSPLKEICIELREVILEVFPGTKWEMKFGVPYYGDKFYIVALKEHVNLGFSTEGLTEEEINLFDGGGKTTKHIKIYAVDKIDRKRIIPLLKLVYGR